MTKSKYNLADKCKWAYIFWSYVLIIVCPTNNFYLIFLFLSYTNMKDILFKVALNRILCYN